jgi:hypothetical protein
MIFWLLHFLDQELTTKRAANFHVLLFYQFVGEKLGKDLEPFERVMLDFWMKGLLYDLQKHS